MSKAFTKESDHETDEAQEMPQRAPLPPGVRNYMTAAGVMRMKQELEHLLNVERLFLIQEKGRTAGVDEAERKRKLGKVDQRIHLLQEILASAEAVSPEKDSSVVRFGAQVMVRNAEGEEATWHIVGADEMNLDQGAISWLSPLAKALLNAKVGDVVKFRAPAGEQKLEILQIR